MTFILREEISVTALTLRRIQSHSISFYVLDKVLSHLFDTILKLDTQGLRQSRDWEQRDEYQCQTNQIDGYFNETFLNTISGLIVIIISLILFTISVDATVARLNNELWMDLEGERGS